MYGGRGGVGDEVRLEIRARGERVIRVEVGAEFRRYGDSDYALNPLIREHHLALWDSLAASGIHIGTVVSLSGIDHLEQRDVLQPKDSRDVEIINSNLFGIQAMLARSEDRPCRYFIVSSSIMDIEQADRIDPGIAGALALAKTLKDEHEKYQCRVIDVAPNGDHREQIENAKRIVEEIQSAAVDDVVALRGSKRWIRDFERVVIRQQPRSENLEQEGAYLILGGLGGVGLLVAEHLAHSERPKLVLTSRTTLPPRTTWNEVVETNPNSVLAQRIRSILSIEETGAQVETITVDIDDDQQMSAAISYVENRFGQVRGIVHTAGITRGPSAFHIWAKLVPEDFSTQSKAKLRGLQVLAGAIQDKDVPFVLMISSNSSIIGGLGFGAYGTANSSMNAFAEQISKQQKRTRWLSVSWDHWPEARASGPSSDLSELYGDLTEGQITKALELKYRYAMTNEEVETALSYVFSFPGSGHLIVSTGDLRERLSSANLQAADSGEQVTNVNDTSYPRMQRPKLKNVFVAPRNELETTLAAIWEDFLGLDRVGIHDDFFELGGHSLLATKIVAHVRANVGADLPLAKLFEGPTIAQIAESILATVAPISK